MYINMYEMGISIYSRNDIIDSKEIWKMNKTVKKICDADNRLQRKLLNGTITEAEFNFRKQKIHKDYVVATSEEELLNKLLKQHGSY